MTDCRHCGWLCVRGRPYANSEGNFVDKHPNILGVYLNAATLFAALFRMSPVASAVAGRRLVLWMRW